MPNGFSLIELMIVLLIMCILACFSYPSYTQYITDSHRIDGKTALLDLANRMENYYSINNTYEKASIATGKDTDVLSSNISKEGWYTLSITRASESTFSLKAIPLKTQAINDVICQELTINNFGEQGSAPQNKDASKSCW